MDMDDLRSNAATATRLLKALGSDKRLLILCRLHEGECSVRTLEKAVGLSQSALSQHLARLRRDGLVSTRREAQTIYYALDSAEASRILATLYDLYCTPAEAGPASEAAD